MSDQPEPSLKPMGEWTVEIVRTIADGTLDWPKRIADAHNVALVASDKEGRSIGWKEGREYERKCNASALADAFKRGKLEGVFASPDEGEVNYVRGLEQQLAAEREALRQEKTTLVDALKDVQRSIKAGYMLDADRQCNAALAKLEPRSTRVKDGK